MRTKSPVSHLADGGETWSTPVPPAGRPKGIGGQPVVQPNGTVAVPFESLKGSIGSFRSTDGGASWSKELQVAKISSPTWRSIPRRRATPPI